MGWVYPKRKRRTRAQFHTMPDGLWVNYGSLCPSASYWLIPNSQIED